MDISWIKITTDVFDDEKILLIEQLPEYDSIIVIWFKLLALAGKSNNNGIFMLANKIPYTAEMFAAIFRRPVNTVRMALEVFEQYEMIEIVDNVVTLPNWEKHQNIESLDKIREQTRKRVQKHRENQKQQIEYIKEDNVENDSECNVTCNDSNATVTQQIREDKNKNKNLYISSEKSEKKEPLRNREPKNDLEKIEKTYLNLWDSLYSQNKVNTQEPIISDWNVIRKIEKGLLKNIPVEKIQMAIENSVNNDFVIQNGYSLKIILSANVINKLINGKTVNNKQGYTPKSAFVNNVYTPIEENPTPTFTEEELKELPF